MRKRTKLFFPFGIISLSLLPVIGFQKIAEVYGEKTRPQYVTEIPYFDDRPGDTLFNPAKLIFIRNYETFWLSADSVENSRILNSARLRLNLLKSKHDTINGVKISFSDSAKYECFIKALDICQEEWPHVFLPYKNDIYAVYMNIDTTIIKEKWSVERFLPVLNTDFFMKITLQKLQHKKTF